MDNRTPYKTAEELNIEKWEHDGLVDLVGPLSRGELKLDMRRTDRILDCGTVACICGWVGIKAGLSFEFGNTGACNYVVENRSDALLNLYYPNEEGYGGGWKAADAQAARAIVNFLVTGDPQWDRVMSEAS